MPANLRFGDENSFWSASTRAFIAGQGPPQEVKKKYDSQTEPLSEVLWKVLASCVVPEKVGAGLISGRDERTCVCSGACFSVLLQALKPTAQGIMRTVRKETMFVRMRIGGKVEE